VKRPLPQESVPSEFTDNVNMIYDDTPTPYITLLELNTTPISFSEKYAKSKLCRKLITELEDLKNHLLRIRTNTPPEFTPKIPFLSSKGILSDEYICMLKYCDVSRWSMRPTSDKSTFEFEVSGCIEPEEFEKRKNNWLVNNGLTNNDIPRMVYYKSFQNL
jgi:hypothetical protein